MSWSVASLRKVIAGVAAGVEGHRHDAQAARLLSWLEQADASGGSQAGAGRGAGWADVADPRPGMLPGGGHGDDLGP